MPLILVSPGTAILADGLADTLLYSLGAYTTGRMFLSWLFYRPPSDPTRRKIEGRQHAALKAARGTFSHPSLLVLAAIASLVKAGFSLGAALA